MPALSREGDVTVRFSVELSAQVEEVLKDGRTPGDDLSDDCVFTEVAPNTYMDAPFPLSLDAQKRLLELIYNRKSGIITRQELINVLYNSEVIEAGKIIRCVI